MKYVAAYALLVLGGNAKPTADQVSALITSVSGSVDKEKVAALVAAIAGKDLNTIIAAGLGKVGTIGAGAATAAPVSAAKSSAPAPAAKKEEPKKEEPKEEEFEGAGDLFDF